MGLFKTIGKIAGTAIGGAMGNPALGKKIGGMAGGALDKKGKKKGKGGGYIEKPTPADMGIDFSKTSNRTSSYADARDPTKVADVISHPFQPAENWWLDLGGDEEIAERFKRIEV